MGRNTHTYAIEYVAKQIGESLDLLKEIASNSDNIDYDEMINVVTGPNKAIIAFTSRGIENLQEFLADVRAQKDGMRSFLIQENCRSEVINRIMADEPR
jgi:hypothetical protein